MSQVRSVIFFRNYLSINPWNSTFFKDSFSCVHSSPPSLLAPFRSLLSGLDSLAPLPVANLITASNPANWAPKYQDTYSISGTVYHSIISARYFSQQLPSVASVTWGLCLHVTLYFAPIRCPLNCSGGWKKLNAQLAPFYQLLLLF